MCILDPVVCFDSYPLSLASKEARVPTSEREEVVPTRVRNFRTASFGVKTFLCFTLFEQFKEMAIPAEFQLKGIGSEWESYELIFSR